MLAAGTKTTTNCSQKKGLQVITKWFLWHGGLAQFTWARAETPRPTEGERWQELETL